MEPKTTEDYIGMCKAEITGSKEIQQDLAYMPGNGAILSCRKSGASVTMNCRNN